MTRGALQRACCVRRKWETDNRAKAETLSVWRTCLEVKGTDLSGEAADVDDR